MPDFAPNFTFRYRVRYSVGGRQHTMQVRGVPATTALQAPLFATSVADFLDALQPARWSDFTILNAAYALADSDVFLPTTAPVILAGAGSPATRTPSDNALALSFPCRSSAGLRGILFLYGCSYDPSTTSVANDFRITSAEDSDISDAIAALTAAVPTLVCNDGSTANWYPYANLKANDYWVRKTRG